VWAAPDILLFCIVRATLISGFLTDWVRQTTTAAVGQPTHPSVAFLHSFHYLIIMSTPATSSAPSSSTGRKPRAPPRGIVKAYLLAYNLVAAASWAWLLFLIVRHVVLEGHALSTLYAAVHRELFFAQSLAILEVLHSMFGIVPSPVFTTGLQVVSRLFVVWGIFALAPPSRDQIGFALAVGSWCLVEVPRYSFYALALVSTPGYIAKFIRYSLFLVLYPSGISGEVISVLSALPWIKKHEPFRLRMPNALNFSFDYTYFCYLALSIYVPGSYIMYKYMLVQRKKQLAPKKEEAKTE